MFNPRSWHARCFEAMFLWSFCHHGGLQSSMLGLVITLRGVHNNGELENSMPTATGNFNEGSEVCTCEVKIMTLYEVLLHDLHPHT